MNDLKNIIFDLGGVILDLSVSSTLKSFSELSGLPEAEVAMRFRRSKGFEQYERGELTDAQFRDFVREIYNVRVGDAEIDRCWNAMLLDIEQEKLDLLRSLMKKFRVFLLSNTNNIHVDFLNKHIMPPSKGRGRIEDYFHKVYYSHNMGTRKPELEIFQKVLDENSLVPSETLFLDDNIDNINGAGAAGIRTAWVNSGRFILDYFHE